MGGVLASLLGGGPTSVDSSSEPSRVMTFDSSDSWKIYFNKSKEWNNLLVVDFSASWCGPCRMIEPFVKSMSNKFADVNFVKIDVDKLPDASQEFEVQAMPTFVFLKKGEEVGRLVGAKKNELEKMVQKHAVVSAA